VSVVFVVPAHGRHSIAMVCLAVLRLTCDDLTDATAVVVADDENLETAAALGFETVEMPNRPLGAKWNAGFVRAAELGADLLVPLGSDDWIDPELVRAQLDQDGEQRCSRLASVVREDGAMLARLRIPYDGGDGVRMMPRALLDRVGFRPCDDGASRAIDTTTLRRLEGLLGRPLRRTYVDVSATQIVDFKSPGNLNGYRECCAFRDGDEVDPWALLAETYPANAVGAMRRVYEVAAAVDSLPAAAATPLPRRRPVVSIPVDRESFTYPRHLLEGCRSALLLFASGRMGAADGRWVQEAGLEDVTAVDWDRKTLEPFSEVYPACWDYVEADVREFVGIAGRRWDVVSADAPSQMADELPDLLPRYCELANRYVVATLAVTGDGEPVVPPSPAGWSYLGEPVYRAEFEGRRFWWVGLERA
jgi:hypothetical protein